MYDNDHLVTTDSSLANQFVWAVSMTGFRQDSVKAHKFNKVTFNVNGTESFTEETIQEHSPLMSGTFTLSVGATPIQLYDSSTKDYTNANIPYNVKEGILEGSLRRIVGFEFVQVERSGNPDISARFIINYLSYNNDVPDL